MSSFRIRVALLSLAVFFAGCSSPAVELSAEDTEPATTEAPVETSAPATTTSTTAAPATTAAPVETTVPAEEPVDGVFEIKAEHAEYCALNAQAREAEEAMGDDGFLDPELLEPFLANNLALLEEARSNVPDEISEDFEVFVAGNYAIEQVLADSGFNFLEVLDDPVFEDPAFEAASDVIEEFGETSCGFVDEPEIAEAGEDEESTGVTPEDIAFMEELLATEAGREAFIVGLANSMGITEEQGECFVDEIGPEGLARMVEMNESGGTDNQVVADTLRAARVCDIDL